MHSAVRRGLWLLCCSLVALPLASGAQTPTPTASSGVSVPFTWQPPAQGVPLGYKLHLGDVSGTYHTVKDVGNVLRTVVNHFTPGKTYYLVVSAYDAAGDGPVSNQVEFTATVTVTVGPPQDLTVDAPGATLSERSMQKGKKRSTTP